jgi:predicted GNAT family acetyltransferase
MPVDGSATLRVLARSDLAAVEQLLELDPVVDCFVSARVRDSGLRADEIGGQLWGWYQGTRLRSMCFSGANLIPVQADAQALTAFAARAGRLGRRCSSIVGPAESTLALWAQLAGVWGPAREVRGDQPLLVLDSDPVIEADPLVRPATEADFDVLLPAAIAMFTEEVGVSPLAGGGGPAYRARLADLIRRGRALLRVSDGQVVFKAELAAVSDSVSQVQGVWVAPQYRGRGVGARGMAAVAAYARRSTPVVSLYVNAHNVSARQAYARVGFRERGRFATVLF